MLGPTSTSSNSYDQLILLIVFYDNRFKQTHLSMLQYGDFQLVVCVSGTQLSLI